MIDLTKGMKVEFEIQQKNGRFYIQLEGRGRFYLAYFYESFDEILIDIFNQGKVEGKNELRTEIKGILDIKTESYN